MGDEADYIVDQMIGGRMSCGRQYGNPYGRNSPIMKARRQNQIREELKMVAHKQDGTKFVTSEGKLSFPAFYEKKQYQENKPTYQGSIILAKGDPDNEACVAAMRVKATELVLAQWPNEATRPKRMGFGLKDGDTWVDDNGDLKNAKYPEFANSYIIVTSNSNDMPGVYGPDNQPIPKEKSNTVYAGCIGRLSFNMSTYTKGKGGVGCWLRGFMKVRDDEPFGAGGGNPQDDFAGMATSDGFGTDFNDTPVAAPQVDNMFGGAPVAAAPVAAAPVAAAPVSAPVAAAPADDLFS